MVNAAEAGPVVAEAASPSPFHAGEKRVQTLTGAREVSEQLGRAWHSKSLKPAAVSFLAEHQLLFTASKNKDGRLWASVLAGPQGFIQSPRPSVLTATPLTRIPGDPAELEPGTHIGTLAIKLETRQRERVNGVVSENSCGKLGMAVEQSFSGCPKYIQARMIKLDEAELGAVARTSDSRVTSGATQLNDEQRDFIERADTLFLASCYYGALEAGDGVVGCDVSHRGGPPGFVQVSGPGTLRFADYIGNFTFTTLGNIEADPRSSIQILDFQTGDSLQLSGECRILWDETDLPGAQRTMEFVTEQWVFVRNALPFLAPGKVKWSPYNPAPSATFSENVGKDRLQQLVTDYISREDTIHMLRCLSTTLEAPDIMTFEFELRKTGNTEEGNIFANPGQFASFDFADLKPGSTVNRTWTISSPQHQMANQGTFTITVKKVGLVSTWLFDNMTSGRTICFRGVDGSFTLGRLGSKTPAAGVLLIAGGIGITPLRTIFHECIGKGIPVTLLHCVRKPQDAIYETEMSQAASKHDNVHFAVTVTGTSSKPQGTHEILDGTPGSSFQGRITADMIQEVCPDVTERAVFQCGPTSMMNSVTEELENLEFPLQNLHQEEFFF